MRIQCGATTRACTLCGKWEIIKGIEKEEQSVVANGQEQEHDHIINSIMCIVRTGIDNRNVMSKYDATDSFICCVYAYIYAIAYVVCMMVFSQTMVNSTKAICVQRKYVCSHAK